MLASSYCRGNRGDSTANGWRNSIIGLSWLRKKSAMSLIKKILKYSNVINGLCIFEGRLSHLLALAHCLRNCSLAVLDLA